MSTASIILAGLKALLGILQWVNRNQALEAGQDKEIAKAALSVLEATQYGKDLRAKVASLSDGEANDLWDRMLRG